MEQLHAEIKEADEALGNVDQEEKLDQVNGEEPLDQVNQVDQEQAAPLASNAETIAGTLQAAIGILSPMFPSLQKVYTPETIQAVSQTVGAVADKRQWNVSKIMGGYAEEIAAVAVVAPVAYATYQAVLHDLEVKAANDDQAKEPEEKGEGDNVTVLHKVEPQDDGDK